MPGEDGAGLVARGRASDAGDRLHEGLGRAARSVSPAMARAALGSPRRAACADGTSPARRSARRPARRRATPASADRPAASGRRRATGGPAAQRCRGSSISASRGTRRPISMSVASSSGGDPSWAEIITPESACTALRVEATRVTVCSWVNSSAAERDSFMDTPSEKIGSSRGCGVVCLGLELRDRRCWRWTGCGQTWGSLSGRPVGGCGLWLRALAAELAAQFLHSLAGGVVGDDARARTTPGVQDGRVVAPAEVPSDRG